MSLVLNFRDIPDNVTVMVSRMGTGMAMEEDGSDLAPLTLKEDVDAMIEEGAEYVEVDLNSNGSGEAVYTFDEENPMTKPPDENEMNGFAFEGTDDELAKEWNEVQAMFTWESGEDMPALGGGYVTVSYAPVGGDDIPRYVAGPTNMVVKIDDCVTTLLFPFVTNRANFDTGLAISNTSSESGACTIDYSGSVMVMADEYSDAPEDMTTDPVEAGEQWIDLTSLIANGFQGYITATCEFRNAYGFAFLTNNYGVGEPTLAQSYLAVILKDED